MVGVYAKKPGRLGVITVGLLNGLLDNLLLRLPDAVVECRNLLPEDEVFSRIESGRSSGWINSVEPNTTSRSMAFSSPRTVVLAPIVTIVSCQFQHYFIGEKSVGRM
jgi:hypothetical protein